MPPMTGTTSGVARPSPNTHLKRKDMDASHHPPAFPAASADTTELELAAAKRFRGVRQRSWGKWVCEIREPRTRARVWLGSYSSADDAARVYDTAALMLYGPQAAARRLNFPHDAFSGSMRPVIVSRATADGLLRAVRGLASSDSNDPAAATAAAATAAAGVVFASEWVQLEVSGPNVLLAECTPPTSVRMRTDETSLTHVTSQAATSGNVGPARSSMQRFPTSGANSAPEQSLVAGPAAAPLLSCVSASPHCSTLPRASAAAASPASSSSAAGSPLVRPPSLLTLPPSAFMPAAKRLAFSSPGPVSSSPLAAAAAIGHQAMQTQQPQQQTEGKQQEQQQQQQSPIPPHPLRSLPSLPKGMYAWPRLPTINWGDLEDAHCDPMALMMLNDAPADVYDVKPLMPSFLPLTPSESCSPAISDISDCFLLSDSGSSFEDLIGL